MSLKKIKLILLDADGVLTDGSIWIGEQGEPFQRFHARDGLGIVLVQKKGIEVGIITGRSSPPLLRRLQNLNITLVYHGVTDKLEVYEEIKASRNLSDDEVAYMGDDLPDIPILKKVGFPAAPADAASEVKKVAKFISPFPGGNGAVRSLVEEILKAQGKWEYES